MPKNAKKILIADDEKFILKAYSTGFEKAGYQVVVASRGDEALEQLQKEKPDIALLDVMMPGMNGFEVVESMRKDEVLKTIPVIILSNLSQEADVAHAQRLGVQEFIVKSDHSLKEIIEMVKKYL